MLEWFAHIEVSALSIAVREIWWVFPFVLVIHSLSMAMMAGFGVVISARAMGFVASLPMVSLQRFYALFWAGFLAASCSGLALLLAYPAKALTNPLFYLKLLILFATSWLTLRLSTNCWPPDVHKKLAPLCLAGWFAVIFAGRFLAYTHTILLASWSVSPAGG